jgi:SAM-dependent methyltransferase
MEEDEYRKLYELENELWWFRGMSAISMALIDRFVARSSSSPLRILDAGCGTGGMLSALRQKGAAFGIDVSAEAIRFASRRGVSSPLVRGDVSMLPFPPSSFDLVTSFDVLYHRKVPDDARALAELSRVLKPGGILLMRVPAYDRLRSHHDDAVHTRHRYARKELTSKLEDAGLSPLFVSFLNCLLFPVALGRRWAERFGSREHAGSEVERIDPRMNAMLLRVLRLEERLLRVAPLPFGLSLVAVGRKDTSAA